MSSSQCFDLHSWWTILALSWFLVQSLGLTTDGNLLLSFKHTVLSDPLGVFHTWNSHDQTPCSWNGVTCGNSTTANNSTSRVIALSLPNSQLLGSIPPNLGMIQHLQILNLSNNSLYGSIPLSLFRSSQLQMLDLSVNLISGELSELVGELKNLQLLNLSNNTFVGKIPENLTNLHNLTFVSLKNNYFSGNLPSGFNSVEVLDLSSNLINGSLPSNFTGNKLRYLNISYNRFLGEIPPEFANQIPINSTVDLSFNNLTGEIPETTLFLNQPPKSFSGNPELCGKPLNNLCPIPSSVSTQPNASTPAIAAIPKTINSAPATNPPGSTRNSFKPSTIVEIVVGDILGISILVLIFFYFHQIKKNKSRVTNSKTTKTNYDSSSSSSSSSSLSESKGIRALVCLRNKTKDSEGSSESEEGQKGHDQNKTQEKRGSIVMVDGGEREIELEELLKASAYLLGATGSSIMYKAVLEDGTAMAVRRIGEGGLERFRDFENQVRVIAKLVHPNLVRIRGFYWGADEKLVIYEFVPNGNLANARYRKVGSSPCHLPWEVRLKIARGVARGLTYIHDKKHVHGNLKPNNILLGPDMEPKIGDFGLERLVTGESGYKPSGSAGNLGSKRSTASRDSFQDATMGVTPSPSPSSLGCISPYYAPESLRNLKPGPKWDVYSFGVILLELLTGNTVVSDELRLEPGELEVEEKRRVLRMADVAIRANLEGKEDALLALFRLGLSCISPVPQKRPPMKEVLNTLEKFPYGHHQ